MSSKIKNNNKSQDEKVLMPYNYIKQVPGKQLRGKLIQAFNYWLNVSEDKLVAIAEIVQMLHNASLLLDDIQDNSILRRGIPVAHSIYGIASTINAANYVMIIALEKCLQLGHPLATTVYTEQLLELHRGQGLEIYWRDNFQCPSEEEYKEMTMKIHASTTVYTEQLLELHRGQGLEIYWRDNFQCPSEEEYKEMTMKKTGGLFMLGVRLMQLFSDNKNDFTKLSSILGLYFQMRDDYCNLSSKEYTENKSFCEDLTEGKFSFPIVHAITNNEEDNQVIHILRQRTRDLEVKKYCISLLERFGSFKYTEERLEDLHNESRAEIKRLGGNPHLEELLEELHNWKKRTTNHH